MRCRLSYPGITKNSHGKKHLVCREIDSCKLASLLSVLKMSLVSHSLHSSIVNCSPDRQNLAFQQQCLAMKNIELKVKEEIVWHAHDACI